MISRTGREEECDGKGIKHSERLRVKPLVFGQKGKATGR